MPSGCQKLTLFPRKLLCLLSILIPEGSYSRYLTDIIWPYKMYLWAFVSIWELVWVWRELRITWRALFVNSQVTPREVLFCLWALLLWASVPSEGKVLPHLFLCRFWLWFWSRLARNREKRGKLHGDWKRQPQLSVLQLHKPRLSRLGPTQLAKSRPPNCSISFQYGTLLLVFLNWMFPSCIWCNGTTQAPFKERKVY